MRIAQIETFLKMKDKFILAKCEDAYNKKVSELLDSLPDPTADPNSDVVGAGVSGGAGGDEMEEPRRNT